MNACQGCGGQFADITGPTHPYMLSSPGCWAAYGDVLAREYDDYAGYSPVHRLTVDAYAVQHPHCPSPENIRSVGFHLCRLCLMLERGLDESRANAAMVVISSHKSQMHRLPVPTYLGDVTVVDVHTATNPDEHREAVRHWAASVWAAWSASHPTVRAWVDGIFR